MILLAELLDRLNANEAFIKESEKDISVSNLAVNAAINIINMCKNLKWEFELFDSAGTSWEEDTLVGEFAPYRLLIRKPSTTGEALVLLTNTGFSEYLRVGHTAEIWKIARLRQQIVTHGKIFQPWSETALFQPSKKAKSPHSLVREFGSERVAPKDIRPWLLREDISVLIDDEAVKVWANASLLALLNSLADEIDSVDNKWKFKGPPKLSISMPTEDNNLAIKVGVERFHDLQRTANWVFENERETELRHSLLANDIARSAGGNGDDIQSLFNNLSASLEGAKVAYQVSLSDLGRDTLKMLADLRKAVTEETAKVTDYTRQLVTSVAGALAISLGLIAVRINAAASYYLIVAVMVIVAAYVGMVIYSGYDFIKLQRQLRSDWQPRLYRFLPSSEYENMVSKPSAQAERTFFRVAWGGGIGISALTTIVVVFGWGADTRSTNISTPSPATQAQSTPEAIKSLSLTDVSNDEAKDNIIPKSLPCKEASPVDAEAVVLENKL